jgi:hypothetical protein
VDRAEDPRSTLRRRLGDWFVRLGLPLAVFAVVLAVFLGEQARITHELQIVAPPAGAPGERLPIRALLFGGLEETGGAELLSAPVRVRLRDGERVLARGRLAPSVAGGAEGHLEVPSEAPGPLTLEAVAHVDGVPVASVERPLAITASPPEAELAGRRAHGVRLFELGPVEPVGDAAAPFPFEVRVGGGACVPEARCEVLVHVGAPAAAARIAPSASVEVGAPSPAGETRGIVRIPVVVHGPEGRVAVEASRGGAVVARRDLQLPVALATPAVRLARRVLGEGRAPRMRVAVLGDRPGVIVDAHRAGVWRATGSMAPPEGEVAAPFGPLGPGLWRLQVRTDPFSARHAAVRLVTVGDADLDQALAAVGRLGGDARAPPGPPEDRFAWAAASVEMGHRVLPPAVSGFEADRARLEARQDGLRLAALVALLLGLVVLGGVLARRGVESAHEAQRVMEATGDPELASARHRRRTLLSALAIVATVLLAFLGAAALIVARAHLLE